MNIENTRIEALDTTRSFIVEAPAGSGKTSLLVNRYLKLLENSNTPENIYALTFTKKAANEMRNRILSLIRTQKDSKFQTKLYNDILSNPQTLKIKTLDAFIQTLIKPNGKLLDEETMQFVYLDVVRQCLYQNNFTSLCIHLDNQTQLIEKFLVQLLHKREQWVYHLLHNNSDFFNQEIKALKNELLENAKNELRNLFIVFKEVFYKLQTINPNLPTWMINWLNAATINELSLEDIKSFSNFCLTKNFSIRKNWTKEQSIYTSSLKSQKILKQIKKELTNLVSPRLEPTLTEIIRAPEQYSRYQNKLLSELLDFLPKLLAHLQLYFQENNVFDHTELTLKALNALEGEQQDFFLYRWTNKIQHLLIDEFQDTSWVHYRLINHLLASFRDNPEKTLFLVGDPMQSIYRFRGAEVGLFLRAQQNDLLPITPLTLTDNFRSSPTLINWFNSTFSKIFPHSPLINLGAIPYTPAKANQTFQGKIEINFLKEGNLKDEANFLWQILQTPSDGSRAILVRSRNHLVYILPLLDKLQYPYHGSELINLSEDETVRNLVSLVRSLFDLTDVLSWLGLLRSTWCGLSNEALTEIDWNSDPNCWKLLQNTKLNNNNSQKRLSFLIENLKPHINQIRITPWSDLIFKIWLQLNPDSSAQENKIAEQVFNCLPQQEELNLPIFLHKIKKRFISKTNVNQNSLQIMTIHKAKGLEFDEVIIPGMNQANIQNDRELINWWERIPEKNSDRLLVSIFDPTEPNHPTYAYLQYINQTKEKYEQARLFYVGCTRAKKKLFLVGSGLKIKNNSFFSLLEPIWQQEWETKTLVTQHKLSNQPSHLLPMRYQHLPKLKQNTSNLTNWNQTWSFQEENNEYIDFLIHQILYKITKYGIKNILNKSVHYWHSLIKTFNLDFYLNFNIINKVWNKLQNNLNTHTAKWILQTRPEQYQKWHISDGKQLFILDRIFKEKDTWWIIDYKINIYSKQIPSLIEQYRQQSIMYYKTLQKHFSKIRLGLFFPLEPLWTEIQLD